MPFSVAVTFLNFSGSVEFKWVEVPNSRFCDYQISGSVSCSPLLSLSLDWDFTNKVTNIPYLGPVLALSNAFMEAIDAGGMKLNLSVTGKIGLSTDNFTYRRRKIPDANVTNKVLKLGLLSEVGFTLKAVADAKLKTEEYWKFSCGGAAHAEAGIKAKLADTETILSECAAAIKENMEANDKLAFDQKFSTPESKQSQLIFKQGKLLLQPKVGFSGLAVYSKNHAQLSCDRTSYEEKPPAVYNQMRNKVLEASKSSSKKSVFSRQWGDEKEKVHVVLGADPLIWQPEYSILGN